MAEGSEKHREAFLRFMQERKLKVTSWARAAGVSRSAVNNFLTRPNASMTFNTLEKLAAAANASVAEMLGTEATLPSPSSSELMVDEEALLYAVRSALRQHIRETDGTLETEHLGPLSNRILETYQELAAEQWAKARKRI
jgi:hypothetical protein